MSLHWSYGGALHGLSRIPIKVDAPYRPLRAHKPIQTFHACLNERFVLGGRGSVAAVATQMLRICRRCGWGHGTKRTLDRSCKGALPRFVVDDTMHTDGEAEFRA